ncbi:MAG: DUF4468 domain-containing protein [Prevotella sp.]|nr:DUF4468 domain-containing protein [Prevotella sp.]
MKRVIALALISLPLAAMAQNDWEVPDEVVTAPAETVVEVNPDQKYLAGAVTEENGKVVFRKVISAPGKSADEIYTKLLDYTTRMTKGKNQFETSRILLDNPQTHDIAAFFEEWLVFKSHALMLDRTRLKFTLIIRCTDGQADVCMQRISYLYDEERKPQNYTAEEWITDEESLNKKQDKLLPLSGKFRRKTIDRKDFIFEKFEEVLNK